MTKPKQIISQYFNVDPKNLKYIAYVRKSTEEADRQAMSIEAQVDAIKKQFPGLRIKFIKESMSAAKPGRELFNKMMDDVEAGNDMMKEFPDVTTIDELRQILKANGAKAPTLTSESAMMRWAENHGLSFPNLAL